jgi:N-acetylglucosamine kinase-like BadF-type ATPase
MEKALSEKIVIADSGATKTDWCLVQGGEILKRFFTHGISPVYQTEAEMAKEIRLHVYPQLREQQFRSIRFYGTGCIPEKSAAVTQALYQSFPIEEIQVYSDLMAAAHGLCGYEPGIACILGTGSNSCEWDGSSIIKQVPPLGFILGDEGSGAALGKLLVGDALKNRLPDGLKERLLAEYDLDQATIIERVYRQPFPSRFLAGLAPFLLKHIDHPHIRHMVIRSFSDFLERNVMQYDYRKNRVNFVGSIAWHFSGLLREVAAEKGIETGKIEQSPMEGLISYYA